MGHELAVLGLDTDALANPFDLLLQTHEDLARRHARPEQVRSALAFEDSGADHLDLEGWHKRSVERFGQIVRAVPVDFSHIPQRKMQLVVILPARAIHPVHAADQLVTEMRRGTQRNEQAVGHAVSYAKDLLMSRSSAWSIQFARYSQSRVRA